LQTEQSSPSNQWVAFFSQTGSEIVALSEKLGRWPNLIVTNQRPEHLRIIDPRIAQLPFLFVMSNKPTLEEYESLFSHLAAPEKLVVTLRDVIDYEEFLQEGLDERAFYLTLRDKALYMWYKFLKVVLS